MSRTPLRASPLLLLFVAALMGVLLPDFRYDELSILAKIVVIPILLGLGSVPARGRWSDRVWGMTVLAAAITVHVAAQLGTYSWIAYDNLRGPWGVDRDTRSILGLVWVAESCVALLAYWIRVLSAAKGRMK